MNGAKHDEMYRWLLVSSGEDKIIRVPKPYRVLHDEVRKAIATAEARNAMALQKDGSPRWALEWLRRRAPKNWPATDHVDVTTTVPVTTSQGDVRMLPPDVGPPTCGGSAAETTSIRACGASFSKPPTPSTGRRRSTTASRLSTRRRDPR